MAKVRFDIGSIEDSRYPMSSMRPNCQDPNIARCFVRRSSYSSPTTQSEIRSPLFSSSPTNTDETPGSGDIPLRDRTGALYERNLNPRLETALNVEDATSHPPPVLICNRGDIDFATVRPNMAEKKETPRPSLSTRRIPWGRVVLHNGRPQCAVTPFQRTPKTIPHILDPNNIL